MVTNADMEMYSHVLAKQTLIVQTERAGRKVRKDRDEQIPAPESEN